MTSKIPSFSNEFSVLLLICGVTNKMEISNYLTYKQIDPNDKTLITANHGHLKNNKSLKES